MTERQERIIAAAIPLFLTEGISVPTARIAKAAGISNGTLFNAFATKQELIDAIYRATKLAMLAAMPPAANGPIGREHMRGNWDGYLGWARRAPADHKVMHLLRDSGLVSAETIAEIDALAADHAQSLTSTLDSGAIRGPSVQYIGELIFAQIDLVIAHELTGEDEDLAFDMLCNTLGLEK